MITSAINKSCIHKATESNFKCKYNHSMMAFRSQNQQNNMTLSNIYMEILILALISIKKS